MSEKMLLIFIDKFKEALAEKSSWGRNHILRLIEKIHLRVLSEELERIENEKN